jgi:hypothetical protein
LLSQTRAARILSQELGDQLESSLEMNFDVKSAGKEEKNTKEEEKSKESLDIKISSPKGGEGGFKERQDISKKDETGKEREKDMKGSAGLKEAIKGSEIIKSKGIASSIEREKEVEKSKLDVRPKMENGKSQRELQLKEAPTERTDVKKEVTRVYREIEEDVKKEVTRAYREIEESELERAIRERLEKVKNEERSPPVTARSEKSIGKSEKREILSNSTRSDKSDRSDKNRGDRSDRERNERGDRSDRKIERERSDVGRSKSDKNDKPRDTEKRLRSDSNESTKSDKTDKSDKSDKSDRSEGRRQLEVSDRGYRSDKSGYRSDVSDKSEKSDSERSDRDRERSDRERSDRERSDREKSERAKLREKRDARPAREKREAREKKDDKERRERQYALYRDNSNRSDLRERTREKRDPKERQKDGMRDLTCEEENEELWAHIQFLEVCAQGEKEKGGNEGKEKEKEIEKGKERVKENEKEEKGRDGAETTNNKAVPGITVGMNNKE